ncbi:phosphonates-binding periplasmic protein-like isoform X2 [Arctopsyche grandis]|uniref:phosphonates-binding periplasmic protein-like isoform X2 n=1 Tax=Arctopsyche grandis TaxID=121162 RepID=UPI00406D8D0D
MSEDSNMEENQVKQRLRVATYMCPSHPVQLYELIVELLEEALDCHATLMYESRSPGPMPGRDDPFESDEIDIAFMSSRSYMKLVEENNSQAELLPVTPVFVHPKNVNNEPGYYADIVIHRDKTSHNVTSLQDLRGCSFAFSSEESLSGSLVILNALNEAGENATFFGNTLKSNSHLASAQMVISKQAEWASVDATTLLSSKKLMQDGGKDLVVLKSIGPLPPYPIVVNKRLSDEVKNTLTEIFLTLPHDGEWKKRFAKFGIVKYIDNDQQTYTQYGSKSDETKRTTISVPYY